MIGFPNAWLLIFWMVAKSRIGDSMPAASLHIELGLPAHGPFPVASFCFVLVYITHPYVIRSPFADPSDTMYVNSDMAMLSISAGIGWCSVMFFKNDVFQVGRVSRMWSQDKSDPVCVRLRFTGCRLSNVLE